MPSECINGITMYFEIHGSSDKPSGPYSIKLFAQDARGLLDHLDIPSAHVVGISMGGMTAFQLTVDHPSGIRRMVIINSGPELKPKSLSERFLIESPGRGV